MKNVTVKRVATSVWALTLLTALPAHANPTLPLVGIPGNLPLSLEKLERIPVLPLERKTFIEEPAFESELSEKLNQIQALRYLSRSA